MRRFATPLLILFAVLLVASLALNCFLFKRAITYHAAYCAAQLDPLGLEKHPRGAQEIDRSKGPVVVFFGDSRAEAWPAPEQVRGVQFVNRGIGGETTAQALGRFPQHVAPLRPNRIVIQLGINDLKAIPILPERKDAIVRDCKENLRRIVELSRESGAQVTVTTIFPTARAPLERRPFWSGEVAVAVRDVNAFIQSLKSDRVTVFDAYKILVNADGIIDPAYSVDLLHVNANGYAALNRELAGILP
jgi:lysophospholipase L1-like esterase